MNNGPTPSYKPSAFYWRKDLHEEKHADAIREMALALVAELEFHKAFIRENGLIPPKRNFTLRELSEKPNLLHFVRHQDPGQ